VIILLIYGFGLHWEAVMALVAAVLPTAINVLVKDLVQRPRPAEGHRKCDRHTQQLQLPERACHGLPRVFRICRFPGF
jgi:hypothetical protein